MTLPPTFSRRKRTARPQETDVYSYDPFPLRLRTQIAQVLIEAIGPYDPGAYEHRHSNAIWSETVRLIRRELGVESLVASLRPLYNLQAELLEWMKAVGEIDDYLDALELLIQAIDLNVRPNYTKFHPVVLITPDQAVAEINARIIEAGFGFQYENREIVQVDSLLLHKEAVIPALRLTARTGFESANAEYMKAHESFRHGDYETCLTECAKAFESVLKIIGTARGWEIQETDPAAKLISAAVNAGFLQSYVAAGFTSLRSMLESGVAPVRNKTAAHGAGTTARVVPKELAAFQLHQTASVIVFLIESHVASPLA